MASALSANRKHLAKQIPKLRIDTKLDSHHFSEVAHQSPELRLTNKRARFVFRKEFDAHLDAVRFVKYFDEQMIVSGGDDCLIKTWRISRENERMKIIHISNGRGHEKPITAGACSKKNLFTASMGGDLIVWATEDGELRLKRKLKKGSEPIWDLLALSPNLLICSTPNLIKFVDIENQTKPFLGQIGSSHNFFGKLCSVSSSIFAFHTFSGNLLDVSTRGGDARPLQQDGNFLQLNDINKPESIIHRFKLLNGVVNALKCNKSSRLLVVGSDNGVISAFDFREKNQIFSTKAHSNSVLSVGHGDTAHLIASGGLEAKARSAGGESEGLDASLRLWDLRASSMSCLNTYEKLDQKFDESILDIDFSETNDVLLAAGADSTIRIFDIEKLL